ncbi:MAG TPA: hypothetical protein PK082_10760 [Phycisphaerae bacterium]|nr:hypothetical protein [Phycisphaerae bacterium]
MGVSASEIQGLPTADQIRQAVRVYLEHAYPEGIPPSAQRLVPPEGFRPSDWLSGNGVERDGGPSGVRSFALRLGNAQYPHMKLRLSRPPKDEIYLFSVDSHDRFLHAEPGSSDFSQLEALKRYNARLAAAIDAAWGAAGLPTEKHYLRQKIRQARERNVGSSSPGPGTPTTP